MDDNHILDPTGLDIDQKALEARRFSHFADIDAPASGCSCLRVPLSRFFKTVTSMTDVAVDFDSASSSCRNDFRFVHPELGCATVNVSQKPAAFTYWSRDGFNGIFLATLYRLSLQADLWVVRLVELRDCQSAALCQTQCTGADSPPGHSG